MATEPTPADSAGLSRLAAIAGHLKDEATARSLQKNPAARVRVAALSALARLEALSADDVAEALTDADHEVRRRGCELGAELPEVDLLPALADPDARVVEAASWALGERAGGAVGAVEALSGVATGHTDALCREAAVAALGAIGDQRGLVAILAATKDKATVRRRAVIALAPFDGPEVDAALRAGLQDRDWQVRQAAEDLIGR